MVNGDTPKYLFQVEFKDGTRYEQAPEDKSLTKDTGSAFSDIVDCLHEIKTFALVDFENDYLVDLTDGHFEINGVPFKMHEYEITDLKLVFFRRHTHDFDTTYDNNSGEQIDMKEKSHRVVYRMGWETHTADGKKLERIMEIS